jgi:hypothetical protein
MIFTPSLNEIGLLVLVKKIFKKFQCIFTLLLLFPLGKGCSPSFVQFRIPPRMICAKSGQNWPNDSGKVENVKVYRRTARQMDDRQQAIKKAHLSFQLR